jgi:predicted DNA-binding transcriptional regulator AlpA
MTSETNTASPLLKTKEVADILRKTPEAVRMMRHRGGGPRGTRVGRDVLYARAAVDAWLTAKADADQIARRGVA